MFPNADDFTLLQRLCLGMCGALFPFARFFSEYISRRLGGSAGAGSGASAGSGAPGPAEYVRRKRIKGRNIFETKFAVESDYS